jgi:serine/threonine protein kinase
MQTAPTKSPKSKARMQKITDFEVLAEIAKSKYSRVVRAYNNVKNRLSVLKILPKMKIVQHNQAE